MLYRCEEWESPTGWHCNCVINLAGGSSIWYLPARILNISPAAFVELMITEYNANAFIDKEKCLVFFTWQKQSDMRRWKNFINKKAREINFQL